MPYFIPHSYFSLIHRPKPSLLDRNHLCFSSFWSILSLIFTMPRTKNASKGKEKALSSQPPVVLSWPKLHLFENSHQHERYSNFFEAREVLHDRCLDKDFLKSIKFLHIQTFKDFGWWKFIFIHRTILEDVVRAFYSNASNLFNAKRSHESFRSSIGPTYLEITTNLIQNVFGIPLRGESYTKWTQNFIQASLEVMEDESIETQITDTGEMSSNTRILHLICCQVLTPRCGIF